MSLVFVKGPSATVTRFNSRAPPKRDQIQADFQQDSIYAYMLALKDAVDRAKQRSNLKKRVAIAENLLQRKKRNAVFNRNAYNLAHREHENAKRALSEYNKRKKKNLVPRQLLRSNHIELPPVSTRFDDKSRTEKDLRALQSWFEKPGTDRSRLQRTFEFRKKSAIQQRKKQAAGSKKSTKARSAPSRAAKFGIRSRMAFETNPFETRNTSA